jgi:uncharacterized membrane protein
MTDPIRYRDASGWGDGMTTVIEQRPAASSPLAADIDERCLAVAAIGLLAAVVRGHAQWHALPSVVRAHIATIPIALAPTPVILLGSREDVRHRRSVRGLVTGVLLIAGFFTVLFDRLPG